MVKKYRIPRNTYNLDGLGIRELQQLVARPDLTRNACRQEDGLVLTNEVSCHLPDSLWIFAAAIVPGGRWLVTGHSLGRLRVWDLEAPEAKSGKFASSYAAQLANCSGHLGVLLIQQTPDCNGVVVLTESLEQDEP